LKQGFLAAVLVVLGSFASAAPISAGSEIGFFGLTGTISGDSPGVGEGTLHPAPYAAVAYVTDSFATVFPSLTPGTTVANFNAISWNSSGALTGSGSTLWSVGLGSSASFILGGGTASLTNANQLEIVAFGTLTSPGFDDTPGTFLYNQTNGTYSAVSVAEVPIPAAAWLFGSALLGFAGISRRKSARA
jgi:hypothetical protein